MITTLKPILTFFNEPILRCLPNFDSDCKTYGSHVMLAKFSVHHEMTINDGLTSYLNSCACKNLGFWETCDFCWRPQYRLNCRC